MVTFHLILFLMLVDNNVKTTDCVSLKNESRNVLARPRLSTVVFEQNSVIILAICAVLLLDDVCQHRNSTSKTATINMGGCEESCGFYFVFSLFTFFVWMDLSFFGELADHGSFYNASSAKDMMFPVKTVKLRMQDHTSHYINLPLMELADERLGMSSLPGVTPNLISLVHLFAAVVAAKCMISGSLVVRRVGVLLYEIRYQLDILDGVVYRAQAHKKNSYASGFGSLGYVIDAFSDLCGGILMATACTLFLWHFPPLKRVRVVSFGGGSGDAEELPSRKSMNECSREGEKIVHWNRRAVVVRMAVATVQLILRSALWDFYLRSYVQLLESSTRNIPRVGKKNEHKMNTSITEFSLSS